MAMEYEQVKEIKVRVYKWKEARIDEKFSDCVLLQGCIINEIMHVKKRNQDLLEASTKFCVEDLEPVMDYLPCSYEYSYETWFRSCFSLLAVNGQGLIQPETATWLSETISSYLVSNYHAVQDTRDFKIVVALHVYMKTIIDESPEIGPQFSLSEDGILIGELLCSNTYGFEQTDFISPVEEFLFKIEGKVGYFTEFFENDRDSLLNLYPTSGDECIIGSCLIEWLEKEPHLLSLNPEPDYQLEEVKPALEMKKYDAGCSKISEESCAICLEELCEGDSVAVTPCSHIFHCSAILGWLTQKMTCPICRRVCPVHI